MVYIGAFLKVQTVHFEDDTPTGRYLIIAPNYADDYLHDGMQFETSRNLVSGVPGPTRGFGYLGIDVYSGPYTDIVTARAALATAADLHGPRGLVLITNDFTHGAPADFDYAGFEPGESGRPLYVESDYFTWTWFDSAPGWAPYSVGYGQDSSNVHGDPACPPNNSLLISQYSTEAYANDYIDSLWPFADHGSGQVIQIDYGTTGVFGRVHWDAVPSGVTLLSCRTGV